MRSWTSSKQPALPRVRNVNKPKESEHYTKMDSLAKAGSLFHKILLASPPGRTTKKIPPLYSLFLKLLDPSVYSRLLKSSSPGPSLRPFSTLNFLEPFAFTSTTNSTMVNSPVKSPAKRLMSSPAKNDSPLKRLQLNGQESPIKDSRRDEEQSPSLYFVKLSDKAHAPTKGSKLAAGYDLKSACECVVPARGSCLVKTDIKIKLPAGTYGRVAPRSGLALKNKIDVGAGVIDEDYRGPVGVILFNHGDQEFKVNEGDRIAQLICEKISYPEIVEVKDLDDTDRGAGGFGSTGVANERAKMDTSV